MRKVSIIFLSLIISSVVSEDCLNPLLSTFGFVGYSSPTFISGIKYCKTLQSSKSCCSANIINNFQTQADQLKNRLRTIVIARDTTLSDTIIKFVSDFKEVAATFSMAADKAIQKLREQNSLHIENIQKLKIVSQAAGENLQALKSEFRSYQLARSKCIVQMIKIQAAAWCLACDPAYTSKGVSQGPWITQSSALCTKIQTSCFDYIQKSVSISLLLQFRALLTVFQRLNSRLERIANGELGVQLRFDLPDMPKNNAAKPIVMPDNCESGKCQWACNNLFKNGNIDEILLGNGGANFGYIISQEERRLEENKDLIHKTRSLLEFEWNPDEDEAGIFVQFDTDPASLLGPNIQLAFFPLILFLIIFAL